MRIGVFGQPGRWSTERLAAALRDAGAEAVVLDLAACSARLPGGGLCHRGRPIARLDGAVVKKLGDVADGWAVRERINLLRVLEASGAVVASAPDRLEVAVDRYRMTVELARAGLPIPDTVVTEDADEAVAAVERFGAAVLKPLFTSKGRGMVRLAPGPDLRATLERHRAGTPGPLYLQRLVEHGGRDLGVAVLGGRVVGAYWRIAEPGAWMTTTAAGGRYAPADPPAAALELAVRAARHFGLLFTGVDLVETPAGGFTVLEVSAFGGFRGLHSACGVDVAPALAAAVLRRVATEAA
jgi:ribosomal protein S6--L-glutamate ligase